MEDVLKDTYGITVYQEQVMILSTIGNFTEAKPIPQNHWKELIDTMNG